MIFFRKFCLYFLLYHCILTVAIPTFDVFSGNFHQIDFWSFFVWCIILDVLISHFSNCFKSIIDTCSFLRTCPEIFIFKLTGNSFYRRFTIDLNINNQLFIYHLSFTWQTFIVESTLFPHKINGNSLPNSSNPLSINNSFFQYSIEFNEWHTAISFPVILNCHWFWKSFNTNRVPYLITETMLN